MLIVNQIIFLKNDRPVIKFDLNFFLIFKLKSNTPLDSNQVTTTKEIDSSQRKKKKL